MGVLRLLCVLWVLFRELASSVGSLHSLNATSQRGLRSSDYCKAMQFHRSQFPGGKYSPSYHLLFNTPITPTHQFCTPVSLTLPLVQIPSCEDTIQLQFLPKHTSLTWRPVHTSWALSLSWVARMPPRSADILSHSKKAQLSRFSSVGQAPSSFWPGAWKSRRKPGNVSWTPLKCPQKIPCRARCTPVFNKK